MVSVVVLSNIPVHRNDKKQEALLAHNLEHQHSINRNINRNVATLIHS